MSAPELKLPSRFWTEWTWQDFAAADMARQIAVLPVAAVEQHGPHLPVGVDLHIMEGYLRGVAADLPDTVPVVFLPVQPVGKSDEHIDFPGTLTLTADTAIRAWTEIGESVHRAGIRKLLLLNSHGGNVSSLDIVARTLRVRHGMLAVTASWHRFGYPEGLFSPWERAHGIHAGDAETSLMRSFRPDLVRIDKAERVAPASVAFEDAFTWLRANHPVGFGWAAQDLSSSGAMGDASAATVAKGEAATAHGVAALIALLRDIEDFDLSRLAPGPLQQPSS